jgi:hypothetical protein
LQICTLNDLGGLEDTADRVGDGLRGDCVAVPAVRCSHEGNTLEQGRVVNALDLDVELDRLIPARLASIFHLRKDGGGMLDTVMR